MPKTPKPRNFGLKPTATKTTTMVSHLPTPKLKLTTPIPAVPSLDLIIVVAGVTVLDPLPTHPVASHGLAPTAATRAITGLTSVPNVFDLTITCPAR